MKRRAGRFGKQKAGTALSKYQRLESTALWRDTVDGQRREVVARMGEATLVLIDPRSERVLSHWSLPAILRLNPGQTPALYRPGDDDCLETIEIEDAEMIGALKMVAAAVRAAKPHPGRLRGLLVGGSLALVAGVAAFVLPAALVSHTAKMVPAAQRADIGMRALDDVMRLTGAPCDGDIGLPVLAQLSERIFGPENTPILYILPNGLSRPAHLPGDVILLPRSLIELDSPEALAGAALAEQAIAQARDPMLDVLGHAGLVASFGLLTSGTLPAQKIEGYGNTLLRKAPALHQAASLGESFAAAKVPLAPYAKWLDPTGTTHPELLAADPFKTEIAPPLLPDDDWIALQSVCTG